MEVALSPQSLRRRKGNPKKGREILSARGISAGYGDNGPVFRRLNLEIRGGETVALLGPNGAGKTTLIRVLSGLLKPSEGEVSLSGRKLGSLSRKEIAREAALVPQGEAPAFAFTVEKLVQMGRYAHTAFWSGWSGGDGAAVEGALEDADLQHLRSRPADRLSGGERQRTVLARALAQSSRFLLLDEPSSHLDLHHVEDLVSLLNGLKKRGLGILIATHDLGFAKRVSDRALVMRKRGGLMKLSKAQIGRKQVLEASE